MLAKQQATNIIFYISVPRILCISLPCVLLVLIAVSSSSLVSGSVTLNVDDLVTSDITAVVFVACDTVVL